MTAQRFEPTPQLAAVPIVLDEKQVRAVVDLTGLPERTVRTVLEGINDLLTGDPIGTIRRSPGGVIAVRVQRLRDPYETTLPSGSGGWRTDSIHTWPIIYQPESGKS